MRSGNSTAAAAGRRWRRVYLGVAAFTAAVILLLYLFSLHYAG